MILDLPVDVQSILDDKISPHDIVETREHLSAQGRTMKYTWPAKPYRDPELHIIRCRGCLNYFDWHEMHLAGSGQRRNTCPDCYSKVYIHQSSDGLSSKDRQRMLGKELYGGDHWAYMILSRGARTDEAGNRSVATEMYFGSTSNIVSRLYQHQTESSNSGVREIFQNIGDSIQWGHIVKSVSFQVFPFDSIQKAKDKERDLYDYWKSKESDTKQAFSRFIVLNRHRP